MPMHTRREFVAATSTMCLGGLAMADAIGAGGNVPVVAPDPPVEQTGTAPHVAWRRDVPVRYECDVAVIGGGIAGVSAALAAARSGARVLLVEGFAVFGGNATIGGVGAFCGETAGQGESFDAIVNALEAFNAIAPYRSYPDADHRVFDHEILAVVLQELLIRRGARLLLHTHFVDACVKGSAVTECIVCGPSGPEAVRAKQFIDCTGEAQLVRQAGFETVKGRPEDGLPLPMSLMFFVRHVEAANGRAQVPEGWFEAIREKDRLPMTSLWPNGPGSSALKIKVPMFDAGDTESMTAAEIRGRRRMMSVLDYFQRVENKPWLLDHCSFRIGIREGRRIVGDHVLSVQDLRAGRKFDDAIARGVYPLDGHKPDDDKRTYILPPEERKVPPYQIPFRSLLPRGAGNVLAAGRCFSADQLALSSARVMTTSSMMGQAAGVAAALAAARTCSPRDLDSSEICGIIRERGANLAV
jgi:hypothetical protein